MFRSNCKSSQTQVRFHIFHQEPEQTKSVRRLRARVYRFASGIAIAPCLKWPPCLIDPLLLVLLLWLGVARPEHHIVSNAPVVQESCLARVNFLRLTKLQKWKVLWYVLCGYWLCLRSPMLYSSLCRSEYWVHSTALTQDGNLWADGSQMGCYGSFY